MFMRRRVRRNMFTPIAVDVTPKPVEIDEIEEEYDEPVVIRPVRKRLPGLKLLKSLAAARAKENVQKQPTIDPGLLDELEALEL